MCFFFFFFLILPGLLFEQNQDDSQQSNSHSQGQNFEKRKRKLAKPRKVTKRKSADREQDTGTSKVVRQLTFKKCICVCGERAVK